MACTKNCHFKLDFGAVIQNKKNITKQKIGNFEDIM